MSTAGQADAAPNGAAEDGPKGSFQRAYAASAWLTCVLISLSFLCGLANQNQPHFTFGAIVVATVSIIRIPYFLKGGLAANLPAARIISAIMLLLAGFGLGSLWLEFSETHGEGPNGEGAPGAFIIAMALFAAVYFCPWLLTTLRGISVPSLGKRMPS